MFEATGNCKKCPSVEQASVCLLESASAKTKSNELSRPTQPDRGLRATLQVKPTFSAEKLDDRSTQQEYKSIHPKTKYLLPLLIVHFLSHTPGIGNSGPSLSEFTISSSELISQKSGLKLS